MKTLALTSALALAGMNGRLPRGLHFAPDRPTLVPQAAANAAGMIGNPAYRTNNINDYSPFDTLPFARNQAEYAFFQTGAGQNGKTRFDTNMVNGAQFPLGRNVVVKAIGFHLLFSGEPGSQAAQIQAFYTILERSFLELVITGRQFEFQAPGSFWMPEIALSNNSTNSYITPTLAASATYERVGDYIKHGGYQLSIPITLQNLIPFTLPWYVDTQNAAVQAALEVLTPSSYEPAELRWQFKATLEQGT
jgi:hypothetical protein